MCLTITGEEEPKNKLCGAHGTCVERECVCESGWIPVLDFAPNLASGNGAEELFKNYFGDGNQTSFKDFNAILYKAAPCVGNEALLETEFIIGTIANLFCLGYVFYFPTRKDKHFRLLKIAALFIGLIYTGMKFILGERAVYPYYVSTSLLFGLFIILMNTVTSVYFYRYAKYHLGKAKLMYSLRVKFYGIDVETLFKYQISFLFFFHILVFSGTYLLPTIYLSINKEENKFSFETMKTLWKIQFSQYVISIIAALYFIGICNIILGALLKDLKLLSAARTHYTQDKGSLLRGGTSDSRSVSLHNMIEHTSRIKFLLTAWFSIGVIFFLFVTIVPGAEYSIFYVTPIQLGIVFPILCILLK
eukprot:maker-scaffold_1-snap-gene-6.1-mRNA-1 protein AED:0.00 eAED:0.00 QI:279/1/1/1/1/1/2/257/360